MAAKRIKSLLTALVLVAGCAGAPGDVGISYQHVASWGDDHLKEPQGLAVSPSGEVFVADAAACAIRVFDSGGRLLRGWGDCAEGPMDKPVDVAVDSSGRILVADYLLDQVLVFTADGQLTGSWGEAGEGAGQFSAPVGIAIDAGGRVYLADFYNHRIQVFSAAGQHLRSISGENLAQPVHYPTKPGASSGDRVWVADHLNRVIQADAGGEDVSLLAPPGESMLQDAIDVFADTRGRLHVADSGNGQVRAYSSNGKLLGSWALPEALGAHFRAPTGLAGDGQGNLFVSDIAKRQIHKLKIVED